jgi:RNA polymerase sigma factor (sigma-70 family)
MIAIAPTQLSPCYQQQHQDKFLEMLPRIRILASRAFGSLGSELKDELIQEVVANVFCAFVRLVHRGKSELAYATPLAKYAIRQALSGRQVGTKANVNDVTSPYAQAACRFVLARLDRFDNDRGEWREVLVEDRRATPADIAAARIDVAEWLLTLPARDRRIAETLAMGKTTSEVASKFGVSPARISQLRGQLRNSWEQFQEGAYACQAALA